MDSYPRTTGPISRPGGRRRRCMTAALAMFVVAGTASGEGNLGFLRDAPAGFFTQRDKELFDEAVRQALDTAPDGEERTWSNGNTGSGGRLTVIATLDTAQGRCRQLRFANRANGRSGEGTLLYCPKPDGEWVVSNYTK